MRRVCAREGRRRVGERSGDGRLLNSRSPGCVSSHMSTRRILISTPVVAAACVALAASPAFAATWSVVPTQSLTAQSGLPSMDLVPGTDGWAVGFSQNGGLVERWNGTQLSIVASPDILDHRSPN